MRYTLITLGAIVTLLITGTLIFILWMGPIVEAYIECNDKSSVGRRVEMDNLRMRLFDGTATADNIILYEADEQTPFVSIDRMEVDMETSALFNHHIHITRAHLTRPYISIIKEGENYNFTDIVEFIFVKHVIPNMIRSKRHTSKGDSKEWRVTIENVTIEDGHIEYLDRDMEQRWDASAINLYAEEIKTEKEMSHMEADMLINDTATVEGELSLNFKEFDFAFSGDIEGFDMSDTHNIWREQLNVGNVEGVANANISIAGNIKELMATEISGNVRINDAQLYDSEGESIICADVIESDIASINISEDRYILNSLNINGYDIAYIIDEAGISNIAKLSAEGDDRGAQSNSEPTTSDDNQATNEMSEGVTLTVGTLSFTDGTLRYVDMSAERAFDYEVYDVSITAEDVDINASYDVAIIANIPQGKGKMERVEGILTIEATKSNEGGSNAYSVMLTLGNEQIPLYTP